MAHRFGKDVKHIIAPDTERIGMEAKASGHWQPDEIVGYDIGLAECLDGPLDDRAPPEVDWTCHISPQYLPDRAGRPAPNPEENGLLGIDSTSPTAPRLALTQAILERPARR